MISLAILKNTNLETKNGERGIRTLGTPLDYDALAMRYLRPLGHLSKLLTKKL